jgi:hypothetical protein
MEPRERRIAPPVPRSLPRARGRQPAATPGGPAPPGWPAPVPPPEVAGWQVPAVSWLLDHCPADYRAYAGWRRYPVALAWIATRHIEAQLVAMRQAYREARVELEHHVAAEGVAQVMADIEAEGVRLLAARRSAGLVYEALQGKRYVPRL